MRWRLRRTWQPLTRGNPGRWLVVGYGKGEQLASLAGRAYDERRQLLQEQIMGLVAVGIEAHVMDRPGGIFVRRAEQISDEDRILLLSVARAIISDSRGGLTEQINRRGFGGKTQIHQG